MSIRSRREFEKNKTGQNICVYLFLLPGGLCSQNAFIMKFILDSFRFVLMFFFHLLHFVNMSLINIFHTIFLAFQDTVDAPAGRYPFLS